MGWGGGGGGGLCARGAYWGGVFAGHYGILVVSLQTVSMLCRKHSSNSCLCTVHIRTIWMGITITKGIQ